MNPLIPVDELYSVGVVVKDLRTATQRFAEVLGIDHWDVRDFGPENVGGTISHGRRIAAPTFRTATGSTTPRGGDGIAVTFELVEAGTGESPFQEFRFRRGQGICHLTLTVRDQAETSEIVQRLAASEIGIASAWTSHQVRRTFIDTRAVLGGYLVEIRTPEAGADALSFPVTEKWDHADTYQRPEGVGPFAVQGVHHFGVVVDDVLASLGKYHEIFGIEEWPVKDWRTEPGRLENAYYRGEPVEHAYLTSLVPIADFGLEIIQPTFGPSHYNREFRDLWGEGVHHMMLATTVSDDEWDANLAWLDSVGIPLVMGADLRRGDAHFCYHDTFAFSGFIIEGFRIREESRAGSVSNEEPFTNDYVIDFSSVIADL